MKNFIQRTGIIWLCLMALVSIVIFSGCACPEPLVNIVIENQSEKTLTIYYGGGGSSLGEIAHGEQITIRRDANLGSYPITAKNTQGEVVFSETYSFKTNLEKINGRTFKGIIPPLKSN
ncbi:hypothetical protein ACFLXD_04255 [Chloroflexota bacterium]